MFVMFLEQLQSYVKTCFDTQRCLSFSTGIVQHSKPGEQKMVAKEIRPSQTETNPLHLLAEDVIRLNEVPDELPGRVDVSTVWRWAQRGVGGVKLETVKIGGKKLTSRQALSRFIAATSRN